MSFLMHRRSAESMTGLYDWFHRHYGAIEKSLGPTLARVVDDAVAPLPGIARKSAIEYACGSGLLTLQLARLFATVRGRDASKGMLSRARTRAADAVISIEFAEGNILSPAEAPKSYDYVFVSFALHLFKPGEAVAILRQLLAVAREAVIIIDHGRRWDLLTAIVEWIEGGYYDQFIRTDFQAVARAIGARGLDERQIADCTYLAFRP